MTFPCDVYVTNPTMGTLIFPLESTPLDYGTVWNWAKLAGLPCETTFCRSIVRVNRDQALDFIAYARPEPSPAVEAIRAKVANLPAHASLWVGVEGD